MRAPGSRALLRLRLASSKLFLSDVAASLTVRGLGTTHELLHGTQAITAVVGNDAALFYIAESALWDLSGRVVLQNIGLAAVSDHGQMLVLQGKVPIPSCPTTTRH